MMRLPNYRVGHVPTSRRNGRAVLAKAIKPTILLVQINLVIKPVIRRRSTVVFSGRIAVTANDNQSMVQHFRGNIKTRAEPRPIGVRNISKFGNVRAGSYRNQLVSDFMVSRLVKEDDVVARHIY